MCVHVYVCIYVCMVCMYVYIWCVCMYVCMHVHVFPLTEKYSSQFIDFWLQS